MDESNGMPNVLNGACAVESVGENRRGCKSRNARMASSVILRSWGISFGGGADLVQRDSMEGWFLGDMEGAFFPELDLPLHPLSNLFVFGDRG